MTEEQFKYIKQIFWSQREILDLEFHGGGTGGDVKLDYLDNGGNFHSINIHPNGTFGTNEVT